jgi:hypothetical protein
MFGIVHEYKIIFILGEYRYMSHDLYTMDKLKVDC